MINEVESRLSPYYWRLRLALIGWETTYSVGDVSARFNVRTRMEHRMFIEGTGEDEPLARLLAVLNRDDIFYDVGANLGLYACLAGQRCKRAHTFEPDPLLAPRIAENMELNGLPESVHEVGFSDKPCEFELPFNENWGSQPRVGRFVVGDEYVRENDLVRPTVLKIDVEGAELAVLRGMDELLTDVRAVLCEIHPEMLDDRGESSQAVHDEFRNREFEIEEVGQRGGQEHLLATRSE